MKLDALKEYIRQEVRNAVREEVKNCLFEAFSKDSLSTTDQRVSSTTPSFSSLVEESVEQPVEQQKKKFVKYTNNPVLNQILNETSGGVPQEGGLAGIMGSGEPSVVDKLNESVIEKAPEPVKAVAQAVTRDYRALLKAVDKKRGEKK
jgi:hypothetical protein